MPTRRTLLTAMTASALLALTGCAGQPETGTGSSTGSSAGASSDAFPVTITHAYGTTTIQAPPKRIASVAWMNHEVPIALGVVPVIMEKATWGDDDTDGVLPWVSQKLKELGAKTPALYDPTDGIDFEAVANAQPDVILASYSGLTKSDYDTLTKIAPTVAFPEIAWGTSVEDMITMNSTAIGKKEAGAQLIASLKTDIAGDFAKHPDLKGKSVLFAYIDPSKLNTVGFYTTHDTRPAFLQSIGMTAPKAVADAAAKSKEFYTTISAEKAAVLSDVDVIVTYGDEALLAAMQKNALLSKIPAVRNGAVALLPNSTPLAAAANPTPLSIPYNLADYLDLLASAAAKAS